MPRNVYLGTAGVPGAEGEGLFVTPNENAALARGKRHISLESLAREIVGEHRVANPVLAQRLMRQAVLEESGGVGDPAGTARELAPVVRELFRAGAELEAEVDSDRARRTLGVARDYRALLREAGMLDASEVLDEAARSLPERRVMHILGYPRLGAQEVAFVDAIAGDGSGLHLPCADDPVFGENRAAAVELRRRGWTVEERALPEPWAVRAECSARATPHREEEVRETLRRVKRLLSSGVAPEEVVLVARDDAAYGPDVLAVAREYGVLVQALYRIPLTRTRLGAWLERLFEAAADGFPYEQTASLLSHPLGPSLTDERWAEARRSAPKGRSGWRAAGVELSGSGWLEDWPAADSRTGWARRLTELLEANELSDRVVPWPSERTALSRLREGIGWIGEAHGLAEERPLSREELVEEVREVLGALSAPVHPEGRGVALHTPLSLFGAGYRHVFVMGMAEGRFPVTVGEDPVLDFHERKRLASHGIRLELAGERTRRERLSFWMLLQVPGERIVFSYPKLEGNREALRSPFLELVGVREEPSPAPLAASPEEARSALLRTAPERLEDPVLSRAARAWEVELRREGSAAFDGHDGITGRPVPHEGREFSVTELRDLAGCGFKWWASSVLGLSEPDEAGSPALVGSMLHEALHLAAEWGRGERDGVVGPREAADLREAVLGGLEAAFAETERRFAAELPRAWSFRREEYLEMLREAVQGEEFAESGAVAVASEASFRGEWRGLRVRGRVDRVDRTPWGVTLVDYKTGSGAPSPNLQLPIYRETAAPELAPDERVQSVYYYSLSKGERIRAGWPSETELEEMAGEIKRKLTSGEFPPDAPVKDPAEKPCGYCRFDPVCRRGPRLSRKSFWTNPEETPGGGE